MNFNTVDLLILKISWVIMSSKKTIHCRCRLRWFGHIVQMEQNISVNFSYSLQPVLINQYCSEYEWISVIEFQYCWFTHTQNFTKVIMSRKKKTIRCWCRLFWFGHVVRMEQNVLVRRVFNEWFSLSRHRGWPCLWWKKERKNLIEDVNWFDQQAKAC